MKFITMVLLTGVFFIGSLGWASADLMDSSMHARTMNRLQLNAQDHLSKARSLEQEIKRLAEKIVKLDQRVTTYEKKPYLDTKDIRRTGLKLLMGSKLNKLKTLRVQMAWHHKEANRLADLENSSEGVDSRTEQTAAQKRDLVGTNVSTTHQS